MSRNIKVRQAGPEKPAPGARAPSRSRSSGRQDRTTTIKQIRGIMKRTQAELAAALGVSEKAIQSYEQGWREVPVRVMIQLLVLLALYQKQTMDDIPCWEIRKCSPDQRSNCASFTVSHGQFCWMIGSKTCSPPNPESPQPIMPCMSCQVVQRLLAGWRPQTAV